MERHGIHLDPITSKPVTDAKTLESERRGVYLAGVIVAGTHTNEIFIENGRFHGKLIADDIAGTHLVNTAHPEALMAGGYSSE